MSDLDNLLDATLDDLDDLPSFAPFPAGAYRAMANMEAADVSKKLGKPCVELSFTLLEVVEAADPNGVAAKEGDTSNTLFMLDNEFGQGAFKKHATPIGQALGCGKLSEIVEQCTDIEVMIIVGTPRKDKNDPDKLYLNLKELAVV